MSETRSIVARDKAAVPGHVPGKVTHVRAAPCARTREQMESRRWTRTLMPAASVVSMATFDRAPGATQLRRALSITLAVDSTRHSLCPHLDAVVRSLCSVKAARICTLGHSSLLGVMRTRLTAPASAWLLLFIMLAAFALHPVPFWFASWQCFWLQMYFMNGTR